MKALGIIVLILGVVGLVLGVIFVVQSGSAKAQVIQAIKDESAPAFQFQEGKLAPERTNLLDTAQEIDQSAEALRSARFAMGKPLNLGNQGQVNYLAFETGLNLARANLGLASLLQLIGVVNIVFGVALVLAGATIYRLSGARA